MTHMSKNMEAQTQRKTQDLTCEQKNEEVRSKDKGVDTKKRTVDTPTCTPSKKKTNTPNKKM